MQTIVLRIETMDKKCKEEIHYTVLFLGLLLNLMGLKKPRYLITLQKIIKNVFCDRNLLFEKENVFLIAIVSLELFKTMINESCVLNKNIFQNTFTHKI